MKKSLLAATVATFAAATPASAADFGRDLGLIVSGVVDSWAGVQIIDDSLADDAVFANGGEGLLSLPLGDNLSIQSDLKYEYNTFATDSVSASDPFGPRYSYQGTVHLSWRDPSRGLFGVFGGAGTADFGGFDTDLRFVGGEAQIYLDNITLYGQSGYVDFSPEFSGGLLDEGFFARGVFRWFMADGSRIQLEGTYLNADYDIAAIGDMEAVSFGAQYDFTLAGLPVIGDTPLYVGYRGVLRDNCTNPTGGGGVEIDDHTIMIGTSYSFSGDRLTVDRQGATLDTPDFNHACAND